MTDKKVFLCYVCGYNELEDEPEWGIICSYCGVTFGYEDSTKIGLQEFMRKWIESEGKWFNEELKPKDWDMKEQLKNIDINL